MQVNKALEEKMWNVSGKNPFNKETCNQIIDYLLARLGAYLQQSINLVGENRTHDTAFSTSFGGAVRPQEPFRITFVGRLGMQVIDEDYGPHYSASLFLFGDHHRLLAGSPDRSFIEIIYEKGEDNIGRWRSLGWQDDEFKEYEDIVEDEYYYKEFIQEVMH